jgi:hypothetical protein
MKRSLFSFLAHTFKYLVFVYQTPTGRTEIFQHVMIRSVKREFEGHPLDVG